MRDHLTDRMNELQDLEDHGQITPSERHDALAQEFGEDYFFTLRDINSLLHKQTIRKTPHAALAAFLFFVLSSAVILSTMVYPGITGAVVVEPQSEQVQITLANGQRSTFPAEGIVKDLEIDGFYQGPGDFRLYISDAHDVHLIAEGNSAVFACIGCGKALVPPYMIEAITDGGTITISRIGFTGIYKEVNNE